MFCFISRNWQVKPLETLATIINLIASTTTTTGLKIDCVVDESIYKTAQTVSDEEMEKLNITPHSFQGKWNYTLAQKNKNLSALIKPLTI
jgi:hypothetical protein